MELGERIQQLRREQGMSQEEVAKYLSVSRQAVSKWELGETRPDIERLIELSEMFHVSTDYLLKGRDRLASEASGLSSWEIVSLSVIAAGSLSVFMSWSAWHLQLLLVIGFLMQMIGCLIFSRARVSYNVKKGVFTWVLLPVPIGYVVFESIKLYPRPVSQLVICSFIVLLYLFLGWLISREW